MGYRPYLVKRSHEYLIKNKKHEYPDFGDYYYPKTLGPIHARLLSESFSISYRTTVYETRMYGGMRSASHRLQAVRRSFLSLKLYFSELLFNQ